MSILFINACVRENSRTLVLAKSILKEMHDEITEVSLGSENIPPLNRELLAKREQLIREGNMDDPMFHYAKQFRGSRFDIETGVRWGFARLSA